MRTTTARQLLEVMQDTILFTRSGHWCHRHCLRLREGTVPGELSIDEAMIAFEGRSFMKQYLPAKPIKWGFKVWTIAEAATGYVCGFQVYVGKRAAPSANGLGYDVVMELSEMYQRRHLYFDNFFSSIKLLRDLEQRQTYACATVRSNRAGLPLVVKQPRRLLDVDVLH